MKECLPICEAYANYIINQYLYFILEHYWILDSDWSEGFD